MNKIKIEEMFIIIGFVDISLSLFRDTPFIDISL